MAQATQSNNLQYPQKRGRMDGSVVRSLASHQRGLSLNPGPGMFIVGSHLPPRFFLQFSSLHKFKFGQETADERSLQTH